MVKFHFLAYMFLGYFSLISVAGAFADKEKVQKTLKKVDTGVKQGLVVYEDAQTYKRELTDKVNGAKGFIDSASNMASAVQEGNLDDALSAAENMESSAGVMGIENIRGTNLDAIAGKSNNLKNTTPSFISNVNDPKASKEEVSQNFNAQLGDGDDVAITESQNQKMEAIQRENLASMYARALSTRVALAKEKAATPEEIDTTDTRQIISAVQKRAMVTAARLKKILEFESAIYDFNLTEKNKNYQAQRTGISTAGGEK